MLGDWDIFPTKTLPQIYPEIYRHSIPPNYGSIEYGQKPAPEAEKPEFYPEDYEMEPKK
jgi:hypothetical protein